MKGVYRMKKIIAAFAAALLLMQTPAALAESDITVKYGGEQLSFNEKPIIINGKTLVQLRPIAEALELGIEFAMESGTVYLSNADAVVAFTQNSKVKSVNDADILMDVPMIIHNDYTFVPVRDLVEPFGYAVSYNGDTRTVSITVPGTDEDCDKSERTEETQTKAAEEPRVISTGSGEYEFVHFYQSQPELEFEENGRGYCWVCSYAMVFSNTLKTIITPIDIAQYNIDAGYKGSFMAGHEGLARKFGLKLVPAISEESPYFAGFNIKNRGETSLSVATDEEAREAICEALDNFPSGVIVRYEGYPHSMVAVAYDDENIYFNDPGVKSGEHVPFEETCLKSFKLSSISSIQAFEVR